MLAALAIVAMAGFVATVVLFFATFLGVPDKAAADRFVFMPAAGCALLGFPLMLLARFELYRQGYRLRDLLSLALSRRRYDRLPFSDVPGWARSTANGLLIHFGLNFLVLFFLTGGSTIQERDGAFYAVRGEEIRSVLSAQDASLWYSQKTRTILSFTMALYWACCFGFLSYRKHQLQERSEEYGYPRGGFS